MICNHYADLTVTDSHMNNIMQPTYGVTTIKQTFLRKVNIQDSESISSTSY